MNIDVIIVFSYLALTLAYGLYVGRGVKNISEYAIGNRDFTTPVLAATIIATAASSSGFFINITKSYEDGLYKLLATSGQILFMFFAAYYIAPRMTTFFGKLSISEIMGSIYGKNIRILSSIPIIFTSVGFVAIQIKVLSTILSHFVGIDPQIAIIFTALTIIIYSAFGGIRAVTLTDFVQFGTFMVAVPLLYAFFWWQLDLPQNTVNRGALIDHLFHFDESKFNYYFMLFLYFLIPIMYATEVQRMLMAKDAEQIRSSYSIAAKLLLALICLLSMIGGLVYVVNPNLNEQQILPFILDQLRFPGLKGALFIGILAMAMSTADSNLNSGAVNFAHDFCKPLGLFHGTNELKIARIFSFICGIFAIIIALIFDDLIKLILFVGGLYLPLVGTPLLFTMFGFRSTPRAVGAGMITGLSTVLFWHLSGLEDSVSAFLPGIVAHMVGLFGTHYLLGEPGGWTGGPGNDDDPSSGGASSGNGSGALSDSGFKGTDNPDATHSRYTSTSSYLIQNPTIWSYIRQFIFPRHKTSTQTIFAADQGSSTTSTTVQTQSRNFSLLELMEHNLPLSSYLYNNVAFYNACLFLASFTFFGILDAMGFVLFTGILLCCFLLIARNLLSDKHGIILLPLYYISCIYTFPFSSTYLFLHTEFSSIASFLIIFSLFIMPVLMSWGFAILGVVVGVFSSLALFSYTEGWASLVSMVTEHHEILLFVALVTAMAKIFLSKKSWDYIRWLVLRNEGLMSERYDLERKLAKSEDHIMRLRDLKGEVLNNFSHEVRTPLTTTGNYLECAINKFTTSKDPKEVEGILKDAQQNFERLKDYILRLSDISSYEKQKMLIDKQKVRAGDLMNDIAKRIKGRFGVKVDLKSDKRLNAHLLNCDILKMRKMFEELAENTVKHIAGKNVQVRLSSTGKDIIMEYKDFAPKGSTDLEVLKTLEKEERGLGKIFDMFEIGSKTGEHGYKGLGLALCREIARSHGGDIDGFTHNELGGGLVVRISIPMISKRSTASGKTVIYDKVTDSDKEFEIKPSDAHLKDGYKTKKLYEKKELHKTKEVHEISEQTIMPESHQPTQQNNEKDSKQNKKDVENKHKSESKRTSKSKKLRVLLVDDDEEVLKSTKMILEFMNCEVYAVATGAEAVNMIKAGQEMDVVLLDIMMPDMTGIEVLEEVSGELERRGIHTIMQSGAGIIDEHKKKLDKFGVSYCPKPYSTAQLKTALFG